MIREVGEAIGRAVLDGIGRATSRVQERKPLPADLLESDDAFLAVFDAPGAAASDVQVRFDDNSLYVEVGRVREIRDDYDLQFPGRGRTLNGEVSLPDDADVEADHADATLTETGILEVLVPKPESGASETEKAGRTDSEPDDDRSDEATGPDAEGTSRATPNEMVETTTDA